MSLSIRAWVWLASPGVVCMLRVQGQFKHGNTVTVLILSSHRKLPTLRRAHGDAVRWHLCLAEEESHMDASTALASTFPVVSFPNATAAIFGLFL